MKKERHGKYVPSHEDVEVMKNLAKVGLTLDQIAEYFGIGKSTLDRLIERDERVDGALLKGRSRGISSLALKAYQLAMAGDRTMLIFLLKTKGGFVEQKSDESTEAKKQFTVSYKL